MSIKSDRWITKMSKQHGMIEPFADRQVREGVISYGVSSYGYDMRVAPEFKIFTNALSAVAEPETGDPPTVTAVSGPAAALAPEPVVAAGAPASCRSCPTTPPPTADESSSAHPL